MRAVIQRVSSASVRVGGEVVGAVEAGLLVLVGAGPQDTAADAVALARKVATLRIFRDEDEKMNRSVLDIGGSALVISQFTLFGDTRRGRRPSFTAAASPDLAEPLVDACSVELESLGVPTQTGRFGADMKVELVNDGPVTILMETADGRVI